MEHPIKTVSSKIVYQNRWIRVREDTIVRPDGSDGIYGVVESKDSVIVGAVNESNEIFLVYSYSYPAQSWQWELPGGGGDGEDSIVASKRELHEETGIMAESWRQLGSLRVSDGLMTERMHVLLATNLTMHERPIADDNELIGDARFFSFDDVHTMVVAGEISEGQSVAALYLIEHALGNF